MRKVDRLFEIVQLLRGKRLRTAEFMANKLGVSTRTIYRDIQGLIASGVPIEGERGVGYLIRQPIELPPLKLTSLEFKALQLGMKMVSATADEALATAAQEASLKINDALSNHTNEHDDPAAHIYFESDANTRENLATLRTAISDSTKVSLHYVDEKEQPSQRIVRPLGLEYWGKVWTLTAWCEQRTAFRAFRVDRIQQCEKTADIFKPEHGKTYQDYLKLMAEK